MSKPMNHAQFVKGWSGATMDELRAAGAAQGMTFKSTTMSEMVEEAWQAYARQQTGQKAAAPEQPKAPEAELAGGPAKTFPAAAVGTGPLVYEGRCAASLRQQSRAGYRFDNVWRVLSPTPSAEQLETLRAHYPRVQVRIKG